MAHCARILCAILCIATSVTQAMIYDNRFWPLYPERFLTYQSSPNAHWYWSVRGIFLGADSSYLGLVGEDGVDEDEAGDLFNIFGIYNQHEIEESLLKSGRIAEPLLPPNLQTLNPIIWNMPGKISLRGATFETEVYAHHNLSFGGSLFAGHMQSHLDSFLSQKTAQNMQPNDLMILRTTNAAMHKALSLAPPCWSTVVFGDIDFYIKGRFTAAYWFKMHYLDVALRFGCYIPSGERIFPYNPVSLPVGGNGHWGLYGQWDTTILLNDLMSTGFSLQVIGRLPRTSLQRMPILTEPTQYGAILNKATVSPGITVVFNPYFQIGGIRDGLGFVVGYYLVHHTQDRWCVSEAVAQILQPNLKLLEARSSWGSDHFSVGAWYDLGYECEKAWYKPIISLIVDIPWHGPVTKMTTKSHAISLRIETQI